MLHVHMANFICDHLAQFRTKHSNCLHHNTERGVSMARKLSKEALTQMQATATLFFKGKAAGSDGDGQAVVGADPPRAKRPKSGRFDGYSSEVSSQDSGNFSF